ncbi:MAG: hypothetical protein ABIP08_02430 [Lautropia sp.]
MHHASTTRISDLCLVSDIYKAGKQIGEGEVDESMVRAIGKVVGTSFGLPVIQIDRM